MSEVHWVRPLAMALFLVAIVALFVFGEIRRRRLESKDAEVHQKFIDEGIRTGRLTAEGDPACVVCGSRAQFPSVRTGRTRLERLWGVRTLNQLYGMPWKYRVVDDRESGIKFCSAHRRAAEQRLERIHASMRAEHSEFNAAQHAKVATLDQGGLIQLVIEDTEDIKRQLGLRGAMRRSFEPLALKAENEVHVLQARTTNGDDE